MESYSLLVHFSTDFDYEINHIEFLKEIKINSFILSIEKQSNASYKLKFGPFNSESDAKDFYPKIQSYLSWISLTCKIGIKSPKNVLIHRSDVLLNSASDSNAYVINNNINIDCYFGGSLTSIVTPGAENIISSLKESAALNSPEKIQEDNKLRLALELYANYFFERSEYAKFINLVNILEALAPSLGDEKISKFALSQLNELVKYAKNKLDEHDKKSNEYTELNSLIDRIKKLEDKATTSMLLKYITEIVKTHPSLGNHKIIKNSVNEAYELRSRLLHGDKVDQLQLGHHLSFLDSFVPELLKTIYIQRAT